MAVVRIDKELRIVIENAALKGATRKELDVLWEAMEIAVKYKPTVNDDGEEFGKQIVNSKEKKIELT